MFRMLRNQVADAMAHEAATGELSSYVCGLFADMCGNDPSCAAQIENKSALAIGFIQQYVQATPMLLDAVLEASRAQGVESELMPVLIAAEDYFLQSVDFIPDHLGLVGVVDDAYLAQSLLQRLSDAHKAESGEALLPFDLTASNSLIRRMIGEPSATSLDAAVQEALGLPEVQVSREVLASKVGSLRVNGAPAITAVPTTDGVNLHLGALGNG